MAKRGRPKGSKNKKNQEDMGFKSSKAVCAKRVRSVRQLARISRRLFDERYQIPEGTMQNWEDARHGGLTEEGARRICRGLFAEGVICSPEWLLHGIGDTPQITERLFMDVHEEKELPEPSNTDADKERSLISKELLLFRKSYSDHIDMQVPDDAMLPRFVKGEFVAGRRRFGEYINECIDQDCIIQTLDGDILLRRLKAGNKKEHYTLACTNSDAAVLKPYIVDVELLSAAPVVWARREDLGS